MRGLNPRFLALDTVFLATAAGATSEEWPEWTAHPAHLASTDHLEFSLRNRLAPPLAVNPRDVEIAHGDGRLVLADTLTMDVPEILSLEGLRGVLVRQA